MSSAPIRSVTVFGAGTIGASWAALFAARGLDVRLYDRSAEALASGCKKAIRILTSWEDVYAPAAIERIHLCPNPDTALANAAFVHESVLEDYAVKREAHETIERFAPADALVASSTSGLLASRMQESWTHPERFLIAHPFNPVHLIPLVELVGGPRTAPECLRKAHEFYAALGKIPVTLNQEVPGHLANRLATAVWREAIDLVARGVASLEDVDKALYAGPGLRWAFMGQHLTYHLAGGPGGYRNFFEHLGPALEVYMADLARWDRVPEAAKHEVLKQMDAHLAGRGVEELERWRDAKLVELAKHLYAHEPAELTTHEHVV
ncbi:MAG: 3-hydroxyacyl-CoA dehydrogenase [Planctomycetota bacterium]